MIDDGDDGEDGEDLWQCPFLAMFLVYIPIQSEAV